MREYMLLIRNEIDHQAAWSAEQHRQFLGRIGTVARRSPVPSASEYESLAHKALAAAHASARVF